MSTTTAAVTTDETATTTSDGSTGSGTAASTSTSTPESDGTAEQWCGWHDANKDLGVDGVCDVVENLYAGQGDCDPWNDDCPSGQKCFNIAFDPACGPLAARPRQLYEACAVLDQGRQDDCDRGLVCYGDICVGVCQCALDFRHCNDPAAVCVAGGNGTDPCLLPCDPLTPKCPPGFHCSGDADGFVCFSGDGDGSCFGNPKCVDGFECLEVNVEQWGPGVHSGLRVPDCTTRDRGCCAELCSLSAGVCSDPRMICSPMGTLPEWEGCTFDAGVCLLPE